jgi:uncharacterized OB-fold protein
MSRVPVAEGLLAGLDEHPRLIASRRRDTGVLSFPAEATDEVEEILLSSTGTLFTWTTAGVRATRAAVHRRHRSGVVLVVRGRLRRAPRGHSSRAA